MKSLIQQFIRNTQGATAIEYGLISSLIAVAIIPALFLVGTKLNSTFQFIADHML